MLRSVYKLRLVQWTALHRSIPLTRHRSPAPGSRRRGPPHGKLPSDWQKGHRSIDLATPFRLSAHEEVRRAGGMAVHRYWCGGSVLVLGIAAGMGGSSPGVVAAGQAAAGQATLQELAERLLAFPTPTGQAAGIQLLPGQVTDQLPLNLALPPGARVVGSLVRNAGAPTASLSVVLDVPGDRAGVQAVYEKELTASGWKPPPPGPQAHGFQFGSQPTGPSIFCSAQGNSWLSLNIYPGQGSMNDVRISTNGQIPNQCHPPTAAAPAGPASANSPIPALYPPGGVALQPSGSGGGPGRWTSEATATTDQKPGALEAHFAQQLQAAKWSRLDGRDDGSLAWSLWKLPDGDWQGLLFMVNAPGQNRRSLHVDAQSASAQHTSAFGTAFAGGQAVAVAAPVAAAAPPPAPAAKPAAATPPSAVPLPSGG